MLLLMQRRILSNAAVLLHATHLLLLSNPVRHVLRLKVVNDQALLLIIIIEKLMVVKFTGVRSAHTVAHLE